MGTNIFRENYNETTNLLQPAIPDAGLVIIPRGEGRVLHPTQTAGLLLHGPCPPVSTDHPLLEDHAVW